MVSMFKTLDSSGLRGFLGCSAVIYEQDFDNLFVNAFLEETDEEEPDKEEKVVEETKEKEKDKEETVDKEKDDDKQDKETTDSEDMEPLSKVLRLTETSVFDEESMAIDDILKQIPEDMILPSILAEEPTQIKFGRGIEIKEVDLYKATIPRINPMDKGKAPIVEEIKGDPAKEIFALISGEIEFLV
ncbi:hypothetical protein F511_26688 [Dorcoceras hygrometricum]|uniref:Uncharacterized protein n=1 Tax=Dorcoceras hygrometricum TaxID=472368 RepID=A0A2Z7B1U5_9LAMI|nr:hypothetical protein F511_26688 [Dorcoceras hygrometricum]